MKSVKRLIVFMALTAGFSITMFLLLEYQISNDGNIEKNFDGEHSLNEEFSLNPGNPNNNVDPIDNKNSDVNVKSGTADSDDGHLISLSETDTSKLMKHKPYRVPTINQEKNLDLLYASDEVVEFRKRYMGKLQKFITASATSSNVNDLMRVIYMDKGSEQGFCSWFNMMIMAFDFATLPSIDRLFQLSTETFGYGQWSDHFKTIDEIMSDQKLPESFNRRLPAPVTNELFKESERLNLEYSVIYNANTKKSVLDVRESTDVKGRVHDLYMRHLTNPFYGKVYLEMNGKFSENMQMIDNIERRRILAQSIWELNDRNRVELDRIKNLIRTRSGDVAQKILAVHIRRGDKIKIGEASEISAEKYSESIGNVLKQSNGAVEHILVFSDDEGFAVAVKRRLRPLMIEYNLAFSSFGDYRFPDPVMDSGNGWAQRRLSQVGRDERIEHASGLLISLTMMAQSDYLVCTFSSNMCRTAQLLRTRPVDTVHSLDHGWHVF